MALEQQIADGSLEAAEALKALVGAEIVQIEEVYDYNADIKLTTADGRVFNLRGNEGCGGCDSGNWIPQEVTINHELPAMITNVEIDDVYDAKNCATQFRLRLIGVAGDIMDASYEGYDDNGYYGYGVWLTVTDATVA
ncbi:MAG: hypothetical protein LBG60_09890 [Bifidobacteriaceae bacterium]|jgi:hypothetical protein|nr:hypothetical protein [Bifidobacteriaceae bacterium]